ncbi:hypothetical protein [Daejeonella oryzae]|uniref:hypothetical protein n=1 Tax=Daejeonella oryzae TaxID=1122943 RepID=UPI00047E7C75|nr:hypothetical protein [Daejeonella oryzae]
MENRFLLPHSFQMVGWIMFIPFLFLGIAHLYFDFNFSFLDFHLPAYSRDSLYTKGNLTDEIAALGLIISLMMIGFSKEKIEDEQIASLRLDSLQWSIYVNYLVLVLAIIFIHGMGFLVAMVYNMFTVLIFFIIRFRWAVYRETKLLNNQQL